MFDFFKKKKPSNKESKVVSLRSDDAFVAAYKKKAQSELQYLIDFMNENERDEDLFRYAIKACFFEGDDVEHMWVQVDEFRNGYFFGRLANEPGTVTTLKYGDDVKVTRGDVEDWILEDFLTNTSVGNFASIYIKGDANKLEN